MAEAVSTKKLKKEVDPSKETLTVSLKTFESLSKVDKDNLLKQIGIRLGLIKPSDAA